MTIASAVQHAFRAPANAGTVGAPYQLLTARARQILGLLTAGMTNPPIAGQLTIGASTVKTHILTI